MKPITLILVLAFCVVLVGCRGPVEEVKAFLDEKDDVLLEMSKKIEADPKAGIDEARKVFEARKGSLVAKSDALRQKNLAQYGNLWSTVSRSYSTDSQVFNMIRDRVYTTPKYDESGFPKYTTWSAEEEKKFLALVKDFREAVQVFGSSGS